MISCCVLEVLIIRSASPICSHTCLQSTDQICKPNKLDLYCIKRSQTTSGSSTVLWKVLHFFKLLPLLAFYRHSALYQAHLSWIFVQ